MKNKEIEKAIRKAIKFYKKDLEEEGLIINGLYHNNMNMLMNFSRRALLEYKCGQEMK